MRVQHPCAAQSHTTAALCRGAGQGNGCLWGCRATPPAQEVRQHPAASHTPGEHPKSCCVEQEPPAPTAAQGGGSHPGTLWAQAWGKYVPNPTGPQACEQWGREWHGLAQGWIWPREEQRWVGAQAGSGGVPRGAGAGARVCMACAWHVHGLCMVCAWCLRRLCTVRGTCMVCSWPARARGICMVCAHTREGCMWAWGGSACTGGVHVRGGVQTWGSACTRVGFACVSGERAHMQRVCTHATWHVGVSVHGTYA